MALTMLDKQAEKKEKPVAGGHCRRVRAREQNPNPCEARRCCLKTGRRVWIIRLAPGERTATVMCSTISDICVRRTRRQHVHDGTTVEFTYARAKPATRPTARASSRFTISKISAIRTWSS